MEKRPQEGIIKTIELYSNASVIFAEDLMISIARWCERLISETCNCECPHCNSLLNLPNSEDIEKWLKGEK